MPEPQKIYTITQITEQLKTLIETNFATVWLKGEISNFKVYPSGHYYFTLKDQDAQISAVMFKGYNKFVKFTPKDGMAIVAHGRLSVYAARGQYQIIVEHLEPDGVGALQLAFEQLKEKLSQEGLFSTERKRPLPFLPKSVGIITSPSGAVIHDMITILKRRFSNTHIIFYPVKVQGEGAADEIAQALSYFSEQKNVDVVIVGRGGGSIEDLWAFNEEVVARAVYSCSVPVISAVGHETDFTICDFVADLRAPTPSAAAELCVPVKKELISYLTSQTSRLEGDITSLLKQNTQHLKHLVKRIPTPRVILDRFLLRLGDIEDNLSQKALLKIRSLKMQLGELQLKITDPVHTVEKLRHRFTQAFLKLNLLDPKHLLKRGYVIAKSSTGKIITRRTNANVGDEICLQFYDGLLKTLVKERLPSV